MNFSLQKTIGAHKALTVTGVIILFVALYFFKIISLDTIKTALIFFAVLSVLVLIHEFGHYMVAKLIGVKIEEFGFGLPPKVFGRKFKFAENEWSLNWLPIGGFVRLAGEDELGESIDQAKKKYKGKNISKFFWARSKWERGAILLAGVTMNFLLAIGITSYLITQGLEEPAPRVKVEEVLPNTPAKTSGLQKGDSVVSIDFPGSHGNIQHIDTQIPDQLASTTRANLGKQITLHVLRDHKNIEITVTPRKDFPSTEGPMGVRIGFDVQLIKAPWYLAPYEALKLNIQRGKDMFTGLISLPSKALQGQKVQNDVAGPIGIAQVTGQAAKIGLSAILNLTSILSLSLALLNVLPVPALDGGRLFFIIIEAIIGKPVRANWERTAHQIGMMVLLTLIALITLNDLSKIFLHG